MNTNWMMRVALLFSLTGFVTGSVAGCVAEVGQACDGFFANGCNSPASCVEGPNGAFCSTSCDSRIGAAGHEYFCQDGFEPVDVTVDGPAGPAPVGCMCVPASAS